MRYFIRLIRVVALLLFSTVPLHSFDAKKQNLKLKKASQIAKNAAAKTSKHHEKTAVRILIQSLKLLLQSLEGNCNEACIQKTKDLASKIEKLAAENPAEDIYDHLLNINTIEHLEDLKAEATKLFDDADDKHSKEFIDIANKVIDKMNTIKSAHK